MASRPLLGLLLLFVLWGHTNSARVLAQEGSDGSVSGSPPPGSPPPDGASGGAGRSTDASQTSQAPSGTMFRGPLTGQALANAMGLSSGLPEGGTSQPAASGAALLGNGTQSGSGTQASLLQSGQDGAAQGMEMQSAEQPAGGRARRPAAGALPCRVEPAAVPANPQERRGAGCS